MAQRYLLRSLRATRQAGDAKTRYMVMPIMLEGIKQTSKEQYLATLQIFLLFFSPLLSMVLELRP